MNSPLNLLPVPEQIDVHWGTFGTRGPGAVVVEIDEQYEWPASTARFQLVLEDQTGEPAFGPVALFQGQRYATIPIWEESLFREVIAPPREAGDDEVNGSRSAISDSDLTSEERVARYARTFNARSPEVLASKRPIELSAYSLWMSQLDEIGNELFRRGPFNIDDLTTPWHLYVTDPRSPCFGLRPPDCVVLKVIEAKNRICKTLSAFSPECLFWSSLLDANPPAFEVVCSLGDGIIAKVSGEPPKVTIFGAEFLAHPWPAETLVHETSHIIDHYGGLLENLRCLDRAEQILADAEERYMRLLGNPDNLSRDEYQRALDQIGADRQYATNLKEDCRYDARYELVETECRALFYSLDRIPLLVGGESRLEEMQNCQFSAVASMLSYLVRYFIIKLSEDDWDNYRHIKPALKHCLGRMIEWLNDPANASLKQRFEDTIGDRTHRKSLWFLLNHYYDIVCIPD